MTPGPALLPAIRAGCDRARGVIWRVLIWPAAVGSIVATLVDMYVSAPPVVD